MAKKNATMTDENLIKMHRRARWRSKIKLAVTLIIIVVVVLVAVGVGVNVLRSNISEQVNASTTSSVESAEVTVGSISTTVSGSGTLAEEDVETVDMPASLEVADYYVEEGDEVSEGDLIATVTNASILSAMADAQATLDEIDAELEEASADEVSDTIAATVSGRVKYIYAGEDDDVVTVMYTEGALMLLSLDGYMAVDIESDDLTAGDEVTVTDSDDNEYTGTIEKNVSGVATIIITDEGPAYGDTVTVTDADGNELGDAELYIHSQMSVTGYAGTVSEINVEIDDEVASGDTLFTLTDTENSVNYDTLLKEREEAKETLDDLILIYQQGGILATIDGVISSLDASSGSSTSSSTSVSLDSVYSTSTSTSSDGTTSIATISPDQSMVITISVDETDILSLSEGQEAAVTIDSIGEDTFEGTVSSISTSATSSSGVTTYSADITVDKTDDMLSGMSASVVITIEGVDDALLIPVDALHETSSTAYVYTEYDEETGEFSGMVEVTTGLSNSSYVEITDGLSEGDTVYYTTTSTDDTGSYGDFSGMDSMGGMDSIGGGMDSMGGSSGGSSGGMDMQGGMSGMPGGN